MQCFRIKRATDKPAREYRLNFRGENHRARCGCGGGFVEVVKRFDAHVIARQRQRVRLVVPNREVKHAVEARQTFFAPLRKGSQQNFRVSLRLKCVALTQELFAQLAIVVDLTAESQDITTIRGKHWLMPGAAGIDDCETTVTETCSPSIFKRL